ncbi:hypothetical protein C7T94_00025 [Pedobacter yulinensis]|uniref:DUF5777 domain-containing protein n=1 Tax=Pedobacter yulinensis TaxID=2126353 RepID=A0A2T3HQ20_9SPHI|nr:DUF5777 family beta-barrel protein [Pedobacter yulinensis]PST84565.1 hypothetical protein C7T94_00025 [Pedobacter yulinensis]
MKITAPLLFSVSLSILPFSGIAQDELEKALATQTSPEKVSATFKSPKLINIQTSETIHRHELDFRVDHRFGDIAGHNGGMSNFFGLDQSTDIRIGFDYGISDRLTAGLARAKGAGPATQLYEGSLKFRLTEQSNDDGMPFSTTLFGSATASAMRASEDVTAATAYRKFADRLSYVAQAVLARKFTPAFSFEVVPTYVHRNFTAYNDENDLFALAVGGRLKVSKRMALVADYTVPFRTKSSKDYIEAVNGAAFYHVLGAGLEIETGGHVFHLNFTNATAIQESQFIPETTSTWTKGQFRWGFSIARRFSFHRKDAKQQE